MNYRCCFCNTFIESTNIDPCDLNILINIDKNKEVQDNQSFYCHMNCFESKLDENIKKLLIVNILDE